MDEILIAEHRKELMEASSLESDLDLAFQLQMQEALVASLALQPSTSSSSSSASKTPPLMDVSEIFTNSISTPSVTSLQTLEFDKLQQEIKDRQQCEVEMRRITEDIKRRIHDQQFAREIHQIDEDDWEEFGDEIQRPFGEGSSTAPVVHEPFRLYFKGLIREEEVGNSDVNVSAIGVAICDHRDNLLLKIQKPLIGDWKNHREVEFKALIEGLNAAITLDIKRINFYCVNRTLFQQITRRWVVKQRKIATLVNQVFQLQRRFELCRPLFVAGNDLKYAFKLARDVLDSQVTNSMDSSNMKNLNETCSICLEDTDSVKMFSVDVCMHRYCFSCMKQHMEVKILQGVIPECPHEGCKNTLSLAGSRKFLKPNLVETMSQLLKEASVPVTEKVYCPYPKCSTLMSKSEALEYANKFMAADRSVVRKCVNCHGLFCIDCKVPWHSTMSCKEFKASNLSARVEEAKLKNLANQNLWRQCVKCNHMIELAEGCYHMTCRCGYEFCYTCGAEWKNKKATCSCKLWDERNIMDDYDEEEDFEDDFDDDDDEFDDDDDDYADLNMRFFPF
ncbi:E3 ubiquitin-protein ligase dbl4 [Thalictrum thalictroides]|uniref:RBR-type E3 ubiquitin transferase n=1 Tax=Thalictrum thalictroides TaxID=46969 RepID=A0A7J6WT89_THATH|nr:E3 ubiquitin-protein ligase dbl4 [Thalictrum thalictroides]